jgi:hypothetical protein
MDILSWIDVGLVSAERDQNLVHYFYDGGVVKSVTESEKHFLILGRKRNLSMTLRHPASEFSVEPAHSRTLAAVC